MTALKQLTRRPHREAFRTDVQTLYDTACCCGDSKIPAVTALVQALADDDGPQDRFDVLRWVIGGFGGGLWSQMAAALLGVDETRRFSKGDRWQKCADLSDKYTSGDSFRHGKVRGKNLIETILDEITDKLVAIADQCNFYDEFAPPDLDAPAMNLNSGAMSGQQIDWDHHTLPFNEQQAAIAKYREEETEREQKRKERDRLYLVST